MLDELQKERHELLLGLLRLTKKLADNQSVIAKNHENLRVQVGRLETRCELQDARIELLDARIATACGILNLE